MEMKKCVLLLLACAGMGLLSSCASMSSNKMISAFDDMNHGEKKKSAEDFYRLGPDDVIRVIVYQHPEWSGEFVINPNGKIRITDLGEIPVEGFTKTALESNFTSYLSKFIREPKISVDIVKYASEVIYVLGEVNHPGKLSTGGKIITLRDAIILAELPTRFARTSTVFVISPSHQMPRKQVINLYRILYHGELENNVEVHPGDIVYVPQNFLGFINDFVSVLLNPVSTAKQAALVP
jgi:polysaccharide export outer membrane protein